MILQTKWSYFIFIAFSVKLLYGKSDLSGVNR